MRTREQEKADMLRLVMMAGSNKQIYVYKDLKVVLLNSQLSDVQ